jgi:hypothetical protein
MSSDFLPSGDGTERREKRPFRGMSANSVAAAARVLLVERRDTVAPRDPNAPKVRRYRLARLQLNGRPAGLGRFDHLRRSYD